MEQIHWKVGKVIDSHVHFRFREPVAHFQKILDLVNYTRINILTGSEPRCLERKRDQPQRFYTFGMIPHDPAKIEAGDGQYRAALVDELIARGYDGIKMMDGKPAWRQEFKTLPIDHAYYEPFWEKAEALDIPITLHQADPVDYWTGSPNTGQAPYRDGPSQESYFREVENVLSRHRNLRIAFAHFLFMGPHLKRLGDLFAKYPKMYVDMAMGDEFLYYLSDDPDASRQFYITWQDRILYGTDISDHNALRHGRSKAEQLRLFLETDQTFTSLVAEAMGHPVPSGSNGRTQFHGLSLPLPVLENVMARNFETFAGPLPKPLP